MADTPAPQGAIPANILAQIKSNPTVKQLLGTMMVREAGGEGSEGMKDALQVAIDRAVESGQSLQDVLMTPDAFTSMTFTGLGGNRNVKPLTPADLQRAYSVIDDPNLKWDLPTTADAFINPTLQAHYAQRDPKHYKATPEWLAGKDPVGAYGHHQFYATGYKGGGKPEQPGAAQGVGQTPGGVQVPQIPGLQDALAKGIQAETALSSEAQAALDKKGELLQKEFDAAQDYRKSLQTISDRFQTSNQKIIDSIPDEQKLRQEELAKVSDQPNDPTRVFGQLLPMLAMFGGAFTKAGVTGSLNAAAAAMNAARGHDEDALKKAHTEFQDQLQAVQEKASLLHEQMSDALAASNGDWNAYLASMNVLAAKYDIPAAKLAVEKGTVGDLLAMQDGLLSTSMKIQDQAIKMADLEVKQREEALKEKVAGESQFDPKTDEYFATVGIAGNPPGSPKITGNLGMGSNPERAKIANDMATISMQRNHTDDPKTAAALDVANGANLHADVQSLTKANANIMQVKGYINGAEGLAKLVEEKIGPGAGPTGAKLLNRYINALRNNVWTDPDLVELRTNLEDLRVESAKIMTGATGSVRAPSDKAAATLEGLVNSEQPAADIEGAITAMRGGWKSRLDGYDQEMDNLRSDVLSRASATSPTPGGQPTYDDSGNEVSSGGGGTSGGRSGGVSPQNFTPQQWRKDVDGGLAMIKQGRLKPEDFKRILKEEYPWVSDHAIEMAVQGH